MITAFACARVMGAAVADSGIVKARNTDSGIVKACNTDSGIGRICGVLVALVALSLSATAPPP